ncbi:hypothetical protein SODALDRAFT_357083 [Sodiomyces alkalinus F11]|uniref:Uncharacterized protein n=1 Tax=Sodiomyces alkalinus (strain CBS 110278 / VKM F-3762 / F11) TaxID=1314773 RepID=A0A3N2Q2V3_SODAK|nr:hypothetical protein SODALDRAFT_357083 [Sodiomyces alkalinus F11]ROT41057.1 hypothetical protein SODALDRAFT_357083 [Sodiomyces alkalinus F11]
MPHYTWFLSQWAIARRLRNDAQGLDYTTYLVPGIGGRDVAHMWLIRLHVPSPSNSDVVPTSPGPIFTLSLHRDVEPFWPIASSSAMVKIIDPLDNWEEAFDASTKRPLRAPDIPDQNLRLRLSYSDFFATGHVMLPPPAPWTHPQTTNVNCNVGYTAWSCRSTLALTNATLTPRHFMPTSMYRVLLPDKMLYPQHTAHVYGAPTVISATGGPNSSGLYGVTDNCPDLIEYEYNALSLPKDYTLAYKFKSGPPGPSLLLYTPWPFYNLAKMIRSSPIIKNFGCIFHGPCSPKSFDLGWLLQYETASDSRSAQALREK